MECPVCKNVSLVMSERQGIEIDYCPNCRGVWLDRGELDKIIERSLPGGVAPQAHQPQRVPDPRHQQHDPRYQQHDPRYQQQGGHGHGFGSYPQHKKKKEGFLSDLFDFD